VFQPFSVRASLFYAASSAIRFLPYLGYFSNDSRFFALARSPVHNEFLMRDASPRQRLPAAIARGNSRTNGIGSNNAAAQTDARKDAQERHNEEQPGIEQKSIPRRNGAQTLTCLFLPLCIRFFDLRRRTSTKWPDFCMKLQLRCQPRGSEIR
jgi:hypothetical protein